MISAEDSYTFVERAYDLGASDYITRPFDARVVCRRVSNTPDALRQAEAPGADGGRAGV